VDGDADRQPSTVSPRRTSTLVAKRRAPAVCGNARRREEVKGCNATAEDGSCRQLVKGTKNGGMERRTPRHTKRTLGCGSARSAGQQANLVHE